MRVPLHRIVLPDGHHPLDLTLIGRLAASLALPTFDTTPVLVEAAEAGRVVLLDGRHRFVANLVAGRVDLPADIR